METHGTLFKPTSAFDREIMNRQYAVDKSCGHFQRGGHLAEENDHDSGEPKYGTRPSRALSPPPKYEDVDFNLPGPDRRGLYSKTVLPMFRAPDWPWFEDAVGHRYFLIGHFLSRRGVLPMGHHEDDVEERMGLRPQCPPRGYRERVAIARRRLNPASGMYVDVFKKYESDPIYWVSPSGRRVAIRLGDFDGEEYEPLRRRLQDTDFRAQRYDDPSSTRPAMRGNAREVDSGEESANGGHEGARRGPRGYHSEDHANGGTAEDNGRLRGLERKDRRAARETVVPPHHDFANDDRQERLPGRFPHRYPRSRHEYLQPSHKGARPNDDGAEVDMTGGPLAGGSFTPQQAATRFPADLAADRRSVLKESANDDTVDVPSDGSANDKADSRPYGKHLRTPINEQVEIRRSAISGNASHHAVAGAPLGKLPLIVNRQTSQDSTRSNTAQVGYRSSVHTVKSSEESRASSSANGRGRKRL